MAKQTKIKPKRVIFSFEPSKIAQKRLLWLQRDFGGLDRTAVLNSCIEAEYQRRRAFQKVGRMSQELRAGLTYKPYAPEMEPNAYSHGPHPADALQSDIRQRVMDPLSEMSFDKRLAIETEKSDRERLAEAESKGSEK